MISKGWLSEIYRWLWIFPRSLWLDCEVLWRNTIRIWQTTTVVCGMSSAAVWEVIMELVQAYPSCHVIKWVCSVTSQLWNYCPQSCEIVCFCFLTGHYNWSWLARKVKPNNLLHRWLGRRFEDSPYPLPYGYPTNAICGQCRSKIAWPSGARLINDFSTSNLNNLFCQVRYKP